MKAKIRGVIFDVGGTLIYSNGRHFEHANAWSAALTLRSWGYALDSRAFTRDLVGLRRRSPKEGHDFQQLNTTRAALSEVAERYGVRLGKDAVERLERAFYRPEIQGCVALPGVVDTVRALYPHVNLAVISNTRSHHLIEGTVGKLGIREHFAPFITSAAFGYRKPSPRPFKEVLRVWQLPAETVVIVGDSLRNDVCPALALRMRTVWQKLDAAVDDDVRSSATAERPEDILKVLSEWGVEI